MPTRGAASIGRGGFAVNVNLSFTELFPKSQYNGPSLRHTNMGKSNEECSEDECIVNLLQVLEY